MAVCNWWRHKLLHVTPSSVIRRSGPRCCKLRGTQRRRNKKLPQWVVCHIHMLRVVIRVCCVHKVTKGYVVLFSPFPGMTSSWLASLSGRARCLQPVTTSFLTDVAWRQTTCRDWPTSWPICTSTGRYGTNFEMLTVNDSSNSISGNNYGMIWVVLSWP